MGAGAGVLAGVADGVGMAVAVGSGDGLYVGGMVGGSVGATVGTVVFVDVDATVGSAVDVAAGAEAGKAVGWETAVGAAVSLPQATVRAMARRPRIPNKLLRCSVRSRPAGEEPQNGGRNVLVFLTFPQPSSSQTVGVEVT